MRIVVNLQFKSYMLYYIYNYIDVLIKKFNIFIKKIIRITFSIEGNIKIEFNIKWKKDNFYDDRLDYSNRDFSYTIYYLYWINKF